jgi:hypothetical protein
MQIRNVTLNPKFLVQGLGNANAKCLPAIIFPLLGLGAGALGAGIAGAVGAGTAALAGAGLGLARGIGDRIGDRIGDFRVRIDDLVWGRDDDRDVVYVPVQAGPGGYYNGPPPQPYYQPQPYYNNQPPPGYNQPYYGRPYRA